MRLKSLVNKPRFLEGELFIYKGIVWVVKGFQHPKNMIIAYPRYLYTGSKFVKALLCAETMYWDCILREVPVIPIKHAHPYTPQIDPLALELMYYMKDSGIDEEHIYFTGGRAVGASEGDIDLVIYGRRYCELAYKTLIDLRLDGITMPLKGHSLVEEYTKHKDIDLDEYEILRRHSVLQGVYKGIRYSIRLVPYDKGFHGCVEKVLSIKPYEGLVEILKPVSPYTTPATYVARLLRENKEVLMRTFRLRYTELPKGMRVMVKGFVEVYADGTKALIPDHGVLRPVT